MKSYNIMALGGDTEYDDHKFKFDMEDHGINIPDHLLYRPEMNDYVLNEVYKQNLRNLTSVENPATSQNYTDAEAKEYASELRSEAKKIHNELMAR